MKPPRILVAPLDWGLGHATRCIPIIKELLNAKCEVWVAAIGDQKALLQEEFPFLTFVEIPGYPIKYGKNRAFTYLKIITSIPKILIRIKEENRWLQRFCALHQPDAVISDNRYGLYAPGLYTIFMTHQLAIRTSFGRVADSLVRRLHYRAIRHFSLCWVPDGERENSLAGALSHPHILPSIPTRYIGLLSRMETISVKPYPVVPEGDDPQTSAPAAVGEPPSGPADNSIPPLLLILLSGPEPQRTLFENLLLEQLSAPSRGPSWPGEIVLVRGLPGRSPIRKAAGDIGTPDPKPAPLPGVKIYDHLPAKALNLLMAKADRVIARAGYSTIMDLLKLDRQAILVPTPGQTEQEYLARYLADRQNAVCRKQSRFNLVEALASARDFPFATIEKEPEDLLKKEITALLAHLTTSGTTDASGTP